MPQYTDLECESCARLFSVWRSAKQVVPRFCSNACKGKHYEVTHKGEGNPMHGRTGELCPSFGVKRDPSVGQKIAASKRGRKFPKISASRRGRKPSAEARARSSATHKRAILAGRPLSGFVKKQYLQGWYKGIHFRSSLELAFMLRAEERGSLSRLLNEETRIPYEFEGSQRIYVTDFYDPIDNVVYEIKHSQETELPINVAKFAAARAFCESRGWTFTIVTQRDLASYLLNRKQVEALPGVTVVPTYRKVKDE